MPARPYAMKKHHRGIFITFEGPDGCGKSTHARLLARHLRNKGLRVLLTREPGGTHFSGALRRILLDNSSRISHMTELLLYCADRAEHVAKVIKPALARYDAVISDRFTDATVVYQGYARGIPISLIERLAGEVCGGIKPERTVILDCDPKDALRRIRGRGRPDRFESEGIIFQEKVRRGYRLLARRYPRRIKVIACHSNIADTQRSVREYIVSYMRRKGYE